MTTPIKPPGQGVPPTSTPDVDAGRAPGSIKNAGDAFQAALDKASSSNASSAPLAADALRTLVADVKAGRTTIGEALDQMVTRALDSGVARTLSPAQRTELANTLRSALLEDPTRVALTKEVERVR